MKVMERDVQDADLPEQLLVMDVEEQIGTKLRELWAHRKDGRPTQEEMARVLELSNSAVSHLITGKTRFRLTTAHVFASALGAKLSELVSDIEGTSLDTELLQSVMPEDSVLGSDVKRAVALVANEFPTGSVTWVCDRAIDALLALRKERPTDEEITAKVKEELTRMG